MSMPTGHHYASSTMGRAGTTERKRTFYGSSLSLADEHGTHELTSRTLRPPSPTTLRKSSTTLPPSAAMIKPERSSKPSLPQMRVELESPKLADYLRYFKPKRFTLKSFKSLFFVCHDLTLTAYKSAESANEMRDVAFQVLVYIHAIFRIRT